MRRGSNAIFACTLGLWGMGAFTGTALAQSVRNGSTDPSMTDPAVTEDESNPAVEARNIGREFRGVNLTPQQREQVLKARRQMRAEFQWAVSSPGSLVTIFRMIFSSGADAERVARFVARTITLRNGDRYRIDLNRQNTEAIAISPSEDLTLVLRSDLVLR